MSGISDYAGDLVLKAMFRNTTWTAGANLYLALFTSGPADSGVGVEVAGGGYARVAIAFGAPTGTTQVANSGAVAFANATANWGTISGLGIFDAATGGNMIAPGTWTDSFAVAAYDECQIPIGAVVVAI